MSMNSRQKIAFMLVMLLALSCFSQAVPIDTEDFLEGFESRAWTMSDGLPGNTTTDIIQDDSGYICIGTYEGLAKFDGINFTTYNRSYNKKYDFASARSLLQDSKGNIWIGSNDEGVSCIDSNLQVRTFNIDNGLPNGSIRSLCEDLSGNIWVGTASGLAYITKDGEVVCPLKEDGIIDTTILVENLYCDNAGKVWLTSPVPNGVYFYAGGEFVQYTQIKSVKDPIVDSIAQDSRGTFWFGVSPHYAVKIDSGVETLYDLGNGSQRGAAVHSIMQDRSGNLWFGMESGIAVLHAGQLSFYNQLNGLVDNNVRKVLEDREGNIWVATDRGGIQKLTLAKFKTVSLPTSVNAIAQDDETGTTWIGTDEGLYCFDKSLVAIKNNVTEYCKDSRVRHLAFTKDNELLISTYGNHAQVIVKKDGSIYSWNKSNGLSGNKTRVALQISNGDLYIGTTTGLNIIDANTGDITLINRDNGLANDFIMCLYEDVNGLIWVGTDGGGVFTLKDRKITATYTTVHAKIGSAEFDYEQGKGLAGNVVFKICSLADGEIWICTGTGVSRLKDDDFFNYSSVNGLGTDSIFQMITDYTGKVWMTSNRGISYVKLSQLEDLAEGRTKRLNIKFASSSDGIHSTGITSTSLSMKDRLGQIWFTLVDGFAIYNPMKVNLMKMVPGVHIEKVTIDNVEYEYDGSQIVIPAKAKRVIIQYTGLTFVSPEQLLFKYKLGGFEEVYSDYQPSRTVSYTNLPPGYYDFTVVAMNSEDVESPVSVALQLVKKPLFYQHWYFWPLMLLVVASIIASLIQMRINQMKHYQEALEQEVKRQTAEIRQKSRELEIAKNKSERLLLNILPQAVAKELSDSPNRIIANQHDGVSILFSDIVGFTKLSSSLKPTEVVNMLNALFSKFDMRAENESIEKIKTIGDAYMAVCGIASKDAASTSADVMLKFAQGIFEDLAEFNRVNNMSLQMRVGINTGNIVAGVIGKTKFIYDIWGDSVNVASRMESTGSPGKIHITESTYIASKSGFEFEEPVDVQVKGKGNMKTYYLKTKTQN